MAVSDISTEDGSSPENYISGGVSRLRGRPLGRAFWRLWAATGISSLGDGLVMVAFPLLAVTLTSDPLLIAGVAIAGRLPALLCSVPAGALADRVDRRRLVVITNIVRTGVLAAFAVLVLAGADSLVLLYATVFVLGAGEMTFDAATQACLPAMVDGASLQRANGHVASAEVSGEQFVGPAMGGLAYAAAGALPFVADAASFAASAALLRSALPDQPVTRRRSSWGQDIAAGLRWFAGHDLLRLLAVVVGSLAFCQAMVMSELVLYGTRDMHLGRVGYGIFFAVSASGNVLGAAFAGRIHARLGTSRCVIAAAVVSGGAYLILAITTAVVSATAALFLEGVAVAVGNVTTLSLRQRVIPNDLLGRVGSAFRMFLYGMIPLGALAGGLIASQADVRRAFVVAGLTQLAVFALAAPVLVRRIRTAEAPAPVSS